MQMMFNVRRQAMDRRRQLCAQPGATCPPLTWTISNRLAQFAPFLLQWYFRCPFASLSQAAVAWKLCCSGAPDRI